MTTSQTRHGDRTAAHPPHKYDNIHPHNTHISLDGYRHGLSCNGYPSKNASSVIHGHSSETMGDRKNDREEEREKEG